MTIIDAIAYYRSEAANAVTDGTRDLNNQVADWLEKLVEVEGDAE